MLLFNKETILFSFYLLSLASTSNAGYEHQDRELWQFPRAFSFYNNQCQQTNVELDSNDFYNNPCPQCSDSFSHSNCISCCAGGASSMKMAWHGCNGDLTFSLDGFDRCDGTGTTNQVDVDSSKLKFIDCDCYDQVLKGGSNDFTFCKLTDSISTSDTSKIEKNQNIGDNHSALICIVSTYLDDDSDQYIVNLTHALPNPLGLKQSLDMIDGTININEQLAVTFFDTSCELSDGNDYIHPLYPDFGKAPGSCPGKGFIDMYGKMPLEADAYNGTPTNKIWFEFLDGTSTSFSPSEEDYNTAIYFGFTFSTCSCIGNFTKYPSKLPSVLPSVLPSFKPVDTPVISPTSVPVTSPSPTQEIIGNDRCDGPFDGPLPFCKCRNVTSEELDRCVQFANKNCVGNNGPIDTIDVCSIRDYHFGEIPEASRNHRRPNQRHLEEVEQVVKLIEQNGLGILGKDDKYSDLTWIEEQITYHRTQLQQYKVDMTYYPHS